MTIHSPDQASERTSAVSSISVVVVDDHALVCESIGAMLAREPDVHVAGSALNADDGIRVVLDVHPDVVLMDIDMPGLSCFDAMEIIRSRLPSTRFIVLTAFDYDEHLERALRVKVNGFLTKHQSLEELAEAVRNVAAGRLHFSQDVMRRLVIEDGRISLENPPTSRLYALTVRERELLRVLARGVSLKEAAAILGISYKTADKQKAAVMSKLDIHNRVELARYAIREGLVEP